MRTLLIIISLLVIPYIIFAQDITDEVDKLATSMGIVYEGMPKEPLYQGFN